MSPALIRLGLVEFSELTLLLVGDRKSYRSLAEEIFARKVCLIEVSACTESLRLVFVPCPTEGHLTQQGNKIEWLMSSCDSKRVAAQLSSLSESTSPGHAYLDAQTNTSGIQLLASLDEYDPANIFRLP